FPRLPPSDSASRLALSEALSGLYSVQLWNSQPSSTTFHRPAFTRDFASDGVPSRTRSMSAGTCPPFSWSEHQDSAVVQSARAPLLARLHLAEAWSLSSTLAHAIQASPA